MAEISREEFDRRFRPAEYAKRKSLGLYGNTERRQTRNDPGMPVARPGSSPVYNPNTDNSGVFPEQFGYSAEELQADLDDQANRRAAETESQVYGKRPRYTSEEKARKAAEKAAKNRNYARGQQWGTNFKEQDANFAQARATEASIEDLNRTGRDAVNYAADTSAIGDAYRRSVSDLTPQQAKYKATYLELGFSEADAERFARTPQKSERQKTRAERRAERKGLNISPDFGEIRTEENQLQALSKLLKNSGVRTAEQLENWAKTATAEELMLLDQAKKSLFADKMVAQDNLQLQALTGQVDPKKAKGGLNIPGKTARGGGPVEKFLIPMLMAPATEEFTDPQTGVTTKQPATYLVPKKVRDQVRMFPQFDADAVNLLFLDPTAEVSPALAEKYDLYKSIDHQEYNREYRGDTNDVRSKAFNTPRVDTANLGDSSNFNIGADTGKVRPMKVGEALSALAYRARTDLVKLRGQAYQDPVTGRTIPAEFYEVAGGDINDPNSAPARVFQRTGQAQDVEIFDLLESRRTAGLTPAEIDAGIEVFRRGGNFMYADTGMQQIQNFLEDLTGERLLVNERMGGMDYGIKNLQAGLVSSVSPGAMRQSQGSSKYPSPVAGLMKLFHDAGKIGDDPTNPGLYPDPRTVQAVAAMPAQSENLSFLDQSMLAADAEVKKELAGMSGFVKGYTPEVAAAMRATNQFFAQGVERQLASENPADQLMARQAIAKFRAKRGI
mgnify:CR=1 FL=1